MRRYTLAIFTATLLSSGATADTSAITNAHIFTSARAGEIQSGTIVISDGRIAAVGTNVAVPKGATIIDAKGGVVTPGLYATGSNLGVVEIELVKQTNDNANSSQTLSAAFDISYGIDPDSMVIPVARLGGITRALVTPVFGDGGERELLFAGQAAIITLRAGNSAVVKPKAAMVLELGEAGAGRAGGARGSTITALKADLDDVKWFASHRRSFNDGSTRELRLSKPDLEALIPVVQGKMKLIVGVHRASDIREALKLAREYHLNIVISGAEEGWLVADELARAHVPVMLNATTNLPGSFETRAATMDNAARLDAAGVTVSFANGDGGHRARESRYNAGNAVAHGLPYARAIAALTINPATTFGDGRNVGSIERGKQADIVIWSGDPLEPLSDATTIFIAGERQPMTSRPDELTERYRTLNGPLPPAYKN
ncbi:MAG: amidohydrolase family protein [Micropepsaceae bacterium]